MALEKLSYELIEAARQDHAEAMAEQRELLGGQHWVDPVRALHVVHNMLDRRVSSRQRLQESAVAHQVLLGRMEAPDALDHRNLPRNTWKEKLKWHFIESGGGEGESAFVVAARWQLAGELMGRACSDDELGALCDYDRPLEGQLALELPVHGVTLRKVPNSALPQVVEIPEVLPFSA